MTASHGDGVTTAPFAVPSGGVTTAPPDTSYTGLEEFVRSDPDANSRWLAAALTALPILLSILYAVVAARTP